MSPDARQRAQQRLDRIQLFREELAELEREHALTLSPQERSRLEEHLKELTARLQTQYALETTESEKRISWGMRVAAVLGTAAFLAALILLLHRVWGGLPAVAHVLVLLSLPLILLGAAEVAYWRRVERFYTGLLVVAAGVGFVMALNALGAIFNLAPSVHALLAWGSFATLVAYAYGLRLPLAAGLLLLSSYSAGLGVSAMGGFWGSCLEEWPESLLPAAMVVYAIPLLGGRHDRHNFRMVYYLCGSGAAVFALFLLSLDGQSSLLPLAPGAVETLYQVISLVVSAGLVFHGLRLGRNGLVNLGSAAFVVFLYVRLHTWWWDLLPKYLFFFVIGLTAIALLTIFRRLRAQTARRRTIS
jgi:uncharacterized membrane protein